MNRRGACLLKRWVPFAIPVALVVTILHNIAIRTLSDSLLIPLAPGEIVALLITGGHGGTHTEEVIATVAGVIVNTIAWSGLLVFAHRMIKGSLTR